MKIGWKESGPTTAAHQAATMAHEKTPNAAVTITLVLIDKGSEWEVDVGSVGEIEEDQAEHICAILNDAVETVFAVGERVERGVLS
jgi:hypothetical protein